MRETTLSVVKAATSQARVSNAEYSRQRNAVPRRQRHADGRPDARVLDTGRPVGRAAVARLPADAPAIAGREPDRFQDDVRRGRSDTELLPSPGRFDVLRA